MFDLKDHVFQYERQNEKEKSVVLTEELDKEWKSLMHVVNTSKVRLYMSGFMVRLIGCLGLG